MQNKRRYCWSACFCCLLPPPSACRGQIPTPPPAPRSIYGPRFLAVQTEWQSISVTPPTLSKLYSGRVGSLPLLHVSRPWGSIDATLPVPSPIRRGQPYSSAESPSSSPQYPISMTSETLSQSDEEARPRKQAKEPYSVRPSSTSGWFPLSYKEGFSQWVGESLQLR